MTEAPPELASRTLVHLRRVFHAIRSQSAAFESRLGLTGPQVWALHVIASAPEGVTVGALAETLALHKANASRLVERLREKKLVASERPERDRRLVVVSATPRGRALLAKDAARPIQVELLDRLETLPPRELAAIERAVAKLVRLLGAEAMEPRLIADD